tara:strand:+ start:14043 stop:14201 length:159 start_codon:yes stop_codon:yes gene_type:complete
VNYKGFPCARKGRKIKQINKNSEGLIFDGINKQIKKALLKEGFTVVPQGLEP